MPKQRTREEAAAYMREYRARQRESTGANGADGVTPAAPLDLAALDLAASIAGPSADDPDVVDLPLRLDDAHFAKLAAVMRAVEACHGSTVKAPAAMRVALDIAHGAIAGANRAPRVADVHHPPAEQ